MKEKSVILQNVRTQYVIRNLETHSMELDILAERNNGDMVGIEIQMYTETAPLKRTRYYLCGIDMSVLEKGKDYDELLQYFKNSDPCYKTETFPRIVELISAEDNLVVLSRWHKSAAKAGSIAEFEANM